MSCFGVAARAAPLQLQQFSKSREPVARSRLRRVQERSLGARARIQISANPSNVTMSCWFVARAFGGGETSRGLTPNQRARGGRSRRATLADGRRRRLRRAPGLGHSGRLIAARHTSTSCGHGSISAWLDNGEHSGLGETRRVFATPRSSNARSSRQMPTRRGFYLLVTYPKVQRLLKRSCRLAQRHR
jgi:hypothetical protein